MTNKDTGWPAFPITLPPEPDGSITTYTGLSMRDYFAAKAMQALIGREDYSNSQANSVTIEAYFVADAMLKARAQ